MTYKKCVAFKPGDQANVNITFKAKKFCVLKVELIELDNPDNDIINIEL